MTKRRAVTIDYCGGGGPDLFRVARDQWLYPSLATTLDLVPLCCQGATLSAITSEVTAQNVVLVTGSGHGAQRSFSGVLGSGAYTNKLFSGQIVHLLACYCAQDLGQDLVDRGDAAATFTYDRLFGFHTDHISEFVNADGSIDLELASGSSADTARAEAVSRFKQYATSVRNTLRSKEGDYIASLFETNADALQLQGNAQATLTLA